MPILKEFVPVLRIFGWSEYYDVIAWDVSVKFLSFFVKYYLAYPVRNSF